MASHIWYTIHSCLQGHAEPVWLTGSISNLGKKIRNLLSARLQRKKKNKKGELKQAAVVESLQHKAGLQPTIENKLCQ